MLLGRDAVAQPLWTGRDAVAQPLLTGRDEVPQPLLTGRDEVPQPLLTGRDEVPQLPPRRGADPPPHEAASSVPLETSFASMDAELLAAAIPKIANLNSVDFFIRSPQYIVILNSS